MIDFLYNANKLMCKMEQFPVAVSNLKYNLLPYPYGCKCVKLYGRYLLKIPVCVSNYTADNEDMCLCVKLYRNYLR